MTRKLCTVCNTANQLQTTNYSGELGSAFAFITHIYHLTSGNFSAWHATSSSHDESNLLQWGTRHTKLTI